MLTILAVLAVLMLLGALPTWPHSRSWGYFPSGGAGILLVILVILLLGFGIPALDLQETLWARKRIRVRSMGDPLGVRQSCHIYSSEAEIDTTLEIVEALAHKT